MNRVVFHEDDNVRLVLDFWRGRVFLHLKVKKWAPHLLALYRCGMDALRVALTGQGYTKLEAYFSTANPRIERFAHRFGFRTVRRTKDWVLAEVSYA